jgi:hypothetical protein
VRAAADDGAAAVGDSQVGWSCCGAPRPRACPPKGVGAIKGAAGSKGRASAQRRGPDLVPALLPRTQPSGMQPRCSSLPEKKALKISFRRPCALPRLAPGGCFCAQQQRGVPLRAATPGPPAPLLGSAARQVRSEWEPERTLRIRGHPLRHVWLAPQRWVFFVQLSWAPANSGCHPRPRAAPAGVATGWRALRRRGGPATRLHMAPMRRPGPQCAAGIEQQRRRWQWCRQQQQQQQCVGCQCTRSCARGGGCAEHAGGA